MVCHFHFDVYLRLRTFQRTDKTSWCVVGAGLYLRPSFFAECSVAVPNSRAPVFFKTGSFTTVPTTELVVQTTIVLRARFNAKGVCFLSHIPYVEYPIPSLVRFC